MNISDLCDQDISSNAHNFLIENVCTGLLLSDNLLDLCLLNMLTARMGSSTSRQGRNKNISDMQW
jgi:hypothetical protein